MNGDLPNDEAGKIAEARNFIKQVTDPKLVGLTAEQMTLLTSKTDTTDTAVDDVETTDNAKRAAVVNKNVTFKDFETYFRQLRQIAQNHPDTTDADRARLHLADGKGSDAERGDMETAPNLLVETIGVHEHRIRFYMTGESTDSTKKPSGAMGCKIRVKIDGAATTDLKDYEIITIDTRSPYNYKHDAANAGKTAHYIGVWTDKDDTDGSQSEAFSIVIS